MYIVEIKIYHLISSFQLQKALSAELFPYIFVSLSLSTFISLADISRNTYWNGVKQIVSKTILPIVLKPGMKIFISYFTIFIVFKNTF